MSKRNLKKDLNESLDSPDAFLRAELQSDKDFLKQEIRSLKKEIKGLQYLEVKCAQLEKDVQFFRSTKTCRDIGAASLAICSVAAPLFSCGLRAWFCLYVACVVAAGMTSLLGWWFSR